ncbi:hypothetical protein NL676_014665 [Syzygium grande]|nr:hypothetical protein NL676_014665 [Syzygium grande]
MTKLTTDASKRACPAPSVFSFSLFSRSQHLAIHGRNRRCSSMVIVGIVHPWSNAFRHHLCRSSVADHKPTARNDKSRYLSSVHAFEISTSLVAMADHKGQLQEDGFLCFFS